MELFLLIIFDFVGFCYLIFEYEWGVINIDVEEDWFCGWRGGERWGRFMIVLV